MDISAWAADVLSAAAAEEPAVTQLKAQQPAATASKTDPLPLLKTRPRAATPEPPLP